MRRPSTLPDELDPNGFLVRDALASGVDAGRLRRRDLSRPLHGVRTTDTSMSLVTAVALVMRRDQYFSHTTALERWGAPLPRAHEGSVHVTTVGAGPLMRRPGVTGHRRRAGDAVVVLDTVRVSGPERAWRACAGLLTVQQLVAVGDFLVGHRGPTTVDALAATILPDERFVAVARAAIDLVRVGADSAMETWLRLAVIDAGFPEPELQVEVFDDAGRFLARVDMGWRNMRIALEYDGDHHRERGTFEHDQRRDNSMTVHGLLVLHANRTDIGRPGVLFERLRQAFIARSSVGVRA